jgi:CHAT domain-containing protein
VDDAATSVLMERFYDQLWRLNRPPLEALRQAQLFVLRNPQQVHDRAAELHRQLKGSKLPQALLAARGIRPRAKAGVASGAARSPVSWWAPWLLSGAPARWGPDGFVWLT